jgi:hypothetical protein
MSHNDVRVSSRHTFLLYNWVQQTPQPLPKLLVRIKRKAIPHLFPSSESRHTASKPQQEEVGGYPDSPAVYIERIVDTVWE